MELTSLRSWMRSQWQPPQCAFGALTGGAWLLVSIWRSDGGG